MFIFLLMQSARKSVQWLHDNCSQRLLRIWAQGRNANIRQQPDRQSQKSFQEKPIEEKQTGDHNFKTSLVECWAKQNESIQRKMEFCVPKEILNNI